MRGSRRLTLLAGPVIGALALMGCSGSETPDDFDRTPQKVDSDLEAVDAAKLQLPLVVEPLELVEPGWDLPVKHSGDTFLSGETGEDSLNFTAVDVHGSTLWKAQRPTGCTGFAVTQDADDTPLAVLTDSASSSDCDKDVTASAYDLETGKQAWGPVDVPGPMSGAGTVFAGDDPAEALALDPSTGQPVETESEESRIIGEYQGLILSVDGDSLNAAEDGRTVWQHSLADSGWKAADLHAFPGAKTGDSYIHLESGTGTGPVLDKKSGDVLADDARGVAQDANTQAVVTLGAQGLTVIDDLGKNELPISVPKSVHLEAATGGLLYLREGGSLRVHNATTGSLARGYPAEGSGVVAIPDQFTPGGVGSLRAGDRTLLATDRVVEEKGQESGGQPEG